MDINETDQGIAKKCKTCIEDCKQYGHSVVEYCPFYKEIKEKDKTEL